MDKNFAYIMEKVYELPTVGARIKYIREHKNFSQAGVCDAAGITQRALSKIERNETNPSIYRIYRIAESLGVDVYMLIPEERWNAAYSVYGVFGHVFISTLRRVRKRNAKKR